MNKVIAATRSLSKKVHVCDVCKKSFVYKSNLTRHILVHTGKKDFQCYVCLKKFSRKYHLTRHMVTQTKELQI